MNGRRLQFGVAVIDDKLFVIGGRDGLKTLNTVECYNPKTKAWTVLPPMSTHRHGLGKETKCYKKTPRISDMQFVVENSVLLSYCSTLNGSNN